MTIKDIARLTGYSVGTVSRVLNHHPNVSEKARRAVTEVISRNGFQRNENAKNLKQQKREGLLVLVKGRKNELFASVIEHLQQCFSETSYSLSVDYFDETQNEVLRAVQLCAEKKPQGLLFLGGNCENFRTAFSEISVPAVLLTDDASKLSFENLSSVCTNDVAAADCAVSYLLSQGHRTLGIIGGNPQVSDTSRMRLAGCRNAMQRNGLREQDIVRETALFSYQDGYAAMRRILATGKPVTAVFAMADVLAIGAIRALHDCGLRVPEDISVCGFDGLPISRFFLPKLTTIRQSAELLAEQSARILLDNIENHTPAKHEIVPYALEVCDSVAPYAVR